MFGAQEHRFRLGAPLTEREVADFERHPRDRRAGRLPDLHHPHRSWGPGRYGDTGPFYGLLPVTAWDEALVEENQPLVLTAAFLVEPGRQYSRDWLADVGLAEDGEEWFPGRSLWGIWAAVIWRFSW
jgi:hypothetical protein